MQPRRRVMKKAKMAMIMMGDREDLRLMTLMSKISENSLSLSLKLIKKTIQFQTMTITNG